MSDGNPLLAAFLLTEEKVMKRRENIKLMPFTEGDHEAYELNEYHQKLNLTEYHTKTLKIEIIDMWDQLKTARQPFENEWDLNDSIYDGEMKKLEGQMFNVHYGLMAEKIDNAVNRADMAFFDGERIFDISPRPDFEGEGGSNVAQKQSDMLDYANEEVIKPREQAGLMFHSAFLKGNGWLFATRRVKKQKKRDRQVFKGEPKYTIVVEGQPVEVDEKTAKQHKKDTGQQFSYTNEPLKNFLEEYPDYVDSGYSNKLHEGKEIKIVVTYDEYVYNDPYFECVDLKDFWIDTSVETIFDISETILTVHNKKYTYKELKKLEKDGYFNDVDKVLYETDADETKKQVMANAKTKKYDILRCVYWCKAYETSAEEEKCVFYIAKDRNVMLCGERFEHDRIMTEYLPFYVKKKKKGIYQPGVGKDLVDDNIALDLYMNFTLQMLYLHSVVIPICAEDSPLIEQYHNKELINGRPITKRMTETIDFLNNHMKPPDVMSNLAMMNKMESRGGEKANITHGMTGKESPTDPSAPASKTLALLSEGNFNFQQYIVRLANSFNQIGYIELAIYHQMEKENIKYKDKKKVFKEITRDELVAKTEIQTQAMAFAIDKLREKQELVAFYSLMRPEMRDMEQVNSLRRMIGSAWSPKVRANIDKLFPEMNDVKRDKVKVALQAVDTYVRGIVQQSQATGVPTPIDPQELFGSIQQAVSDYANPPDAKEIKKRQTVSKGGG